MSTSTLIQPDQITDQVSKIVKSEQFRNSKILSNFLQYVVKETLDGNERSLKEYVIATEVLKKSADFDPQLDAVVRIHARRLRQELNKYYTGAGKEDPIKISIPKGRYIPVFEKNIVSKIPAPTGQNEKELQVETTPTVAVFPFDCMESNQRGNVICSVLARDITVGLSYFPEIEVISTHSAEFVKENMKGWKEMVSHLGTDYVITGSCLRDRGNLKVNALLHHCKNDQILWAETMIIEDYALDEIKSYESVVKKVVAKTCGFFGYIFQSELSHHIPQDYNTLYAIYWHTRFHRQFTQEAFLESSKAIDKALSINPENALMTAFKAELLLNLSVMEVEGEMDFFKQGCHLIAHSLKLDKNSQHAWQVYCWSKLLERNASEYNRAAEKCLAINPHNSESIGAIGFGHTCVGRYKEGYELMLESIELNPFYPWVANLGMCFYYLNKQEFEDAHYWAELINRPGSLWYNLARVSTLGLLNKSEEASQAISELFEVSPNFKERAHYIVGRFIDDESLKASILKGLRMAGVDFVQTS